MGKYLFTILIAVLSLLIGQSSAGNPCDSIQCKGKVFETIQLRNIFSDGKHFVDMASKYSPETIQESFDELPTNITDEDLRQWVRNNFFEPGYELEAVKPDDWIEEPDVLLKQRNIQLLEMSTEVHRRWLDLTRQINESKLPDESQSTLIPVKNPFVVVGGRFTEFYYWDSYWIIEGLLASQMTETAAGFIQNFIEIIQKLNFMPNGARTYFANRFRDLVKRTSLQISNRNFRRKLFQ